MKRCLPGQAPDTVSPAEIARLLEVLQVKGTPRLKAAGRLQAVARANPGLLYPHFFVFEALLDSPSSVLLWNALIILSCLATTDPDRRFDAVLDRYFAHLWDGKLVTAANVLASSGRIARARPDLAARITAELLKVEDIPLPTPECREVARGHVLSSFAEYADCLKGDPRVLEFVRLCQRSHRPAVARRAEHLLQRL